MRDFLIVIFVIFATVDAVSFIVIFLPGRSIITFRSTNWIFSEC